MKQLESNFKSKISTNQLFPQQCETEFDMICEQQIEEDYFHKLIDLTMNTYFKLQKEDQENYGLYQSAAHYVKEQYVNYELNEDYMKYFINFSRMKFHDKRTLIENSYELDQVRSAIYPTNNEKPKDRALLIQFKNLYLAGQDHYSNVKTEQYQPDQFHILTLQEEGHITFTSSVILYSLYIKTNSQKNTSIKFRIQDGLIKIGKVKDLSGWQRAIYNISDVVEIIIPSYVLVDCIEFYAIKAEVSEFEYEQTIQIALFQQIEMNKAQQQLSQLQQTQDQKSKLKQLVIKDDQDASAFEVLSSLLNRLRELVTERRKLTKNLSRSDIQELLDKLQQENHQKDYYRSIILGLKSQEYDEQELDELFRTIDQLR
ncbi:hypothetical protein pb186bvf_000184 [Paramecium bursaria]